jgi:hypothetical protein
VPPVTVFTLLDEDELALELLVTLEVVADAG